VTTINIQIPKNMIEALKLSKSDNWPIWGWLRRLVGICFPKTPEVAKPLRPIVEKYFEQHPDAKDEVMKAYFAYHTQHIRDNPGAHNFAGPWRNCECQWCGRSRELVRWDDLPAQCQKRPELPDIADTIRGEEEKAFALLDKATREVLRLVAKLGMSGETLAVLHHTHGYDPETVDGVVSVPPQIMADYHTAMETERDRSRAAIVREVVTARTTGDSAANASEWLKPTT
jgi:hypothetical protein